MAESYNGPPVSPYWSLKAFAIFDDSRRCAILAGRNRAAARAGTAEIVAPRRDAGAAPSPHDVVAYVPGVHHENNQVHVPEKYSKFAYSTHFGFSVPRSGKRITEAVPDSMLAFEISGHNFCAAADRQLHRGRTPRRLHMVAV